MECKLRPWRLSDAADLAAAINNKKVQDNLRDGLPFPYTEQDAIEFITTMQNADPHNTFAFAATLRSNAVKNGKIIDMKLYARIKA